MKTLVDQAKDGIITSRMKQVAGSGRHGPRTVLSPDSSGQCRDHAAGGPAHRNRQGTFHQGQCESRYINGKGECLEEEIRKARIAEEFGADTISDLSMGGDISAIRREILSCTTLPVTTVPVYQAVVENGLKKMTADDILSTLEMQAEAGDQFAGDPLREPEDACRDSGSRKNGFSAWYPKGGPSPAHSCSSTSARTRLSSSSTGSCRSAGNMTSSSPWAILHGAGVSMTGAIPSSWRRSARTLLLHTGHSMPGYRSSSKGPAATSGADRIPAYIRYYKKQSPFPLFVAGPLPTDIGIGYDHIAGACGGSMASAAGADYLCYITPAEHLGLPSPEAVKEGLIAFRIAAHIGDTVKYGRDAQDRKVALLRADLDREGQIRCAMDPQRARELSDGEKECTMCGEFCAIKIMREF